MDNITYGVKDGYGIRGAAAWDKAVTHIKHLCVNVLDKRMYLPIFNFMFSDGSNGGLNELSVVQIDNLWINDPYEDFNYTIKEPHLSSKIKRR